MATIIMACAITLVVIMTATIAFGRSFDGAHIWVLTLFVLLVTALVRRIYPTTKTGAEGAKPKGPDR